MMIRLRDWFPEPTPAHTPGRKKKKFPPKKGVATVKEKKFGIRSFVSVSPEKVECGHLPGGERRNQI
jgi:hypothetical protein